MAWFDGIKKITLPGFPVNAFGKLPFYKEYLYLCPDPAFAELKAWVDECFEQLSRQGADPPYLAPNRHFLVHLPASKTDLVGSIWDSHDGLRAFPFMIAMAMPRKARKHGLPLFWQCLNTVWDYFERYFKHLGEADSASDFYKRIRGVVHQLPKIAQSPWPERGGDAEEGRDNLERGGLACFDLRDYSQTVEAWLSDLGLGQLPNFVLWPQRDFQATPHEAMGYIGMDGLAMMALDLLQPKLLSGQALKEAQTLAHGMAIAAKVEAKHSSGEDTSETETIILREDEKPSPESESAEQAQGPEEKPAADLDEEIQGVREGETLNLPPLSPIAETLATKEDDIPPSWLENPTDETLSDYLPEIVEATSDPDDTLAQRELSEAPTMELSLNIGGTTSEIPLLNHPSEQVGEVTDLVPTGQGLEDEEGDGRAGEAISPEGNEAAEKPDATDQPPAGRRADLPGNER